MREINNRCASPRGRAGPISSPMPNAGLPRHPDGLEFIIPRSRLSGSGNERSVERRARKTARARLTASDPRQCQPQAEQVDRFGEMHVEPGIMPALLVRRSEVGAHCNRRDLRIVAPYLGDEIVAVLVRQTNVAQDHIHIVLPEKIESARGRIAGGYFMSPTPKNCGESALGVLMVLDQEN